MFKSIWLWVVVVIIIVAGVMGMSYYNSFITLGQSADTQWAQVENQFQRRYDLIPNLVESVKGIFNQEKEVFTAIADARTKYGGVVANPSATVGDKVAAAQGVESALGRLLVVMENYPQLKSSENVTRLMDELAGTENRVAVERGQFNEFVKAYNLAVMTLPGKLFASVFGFSERALFEATQGAETAPEVKF
jgi:LemA protein